jgi:peptidoglycan/LPS O-acetylase OafA/YrhL
MASQAVRASTGFRADLQGIRGLAVTLVVAYHAGYLTPGGFVGVDVFFVLSGYLIIGLIAREIDETGSLVLRDFFARRVRRLLPALAATTAATVLLSTVVVELGDPLRAVVRTALGASLFAANGILYLDQDYFAPTADRNPLLHTWSLSLEEQFYIAVPLLLSLVAYLARRGAAGRPSSGRWRARATHSLLAMTLLSLGFAVAVVDLGIGVPGLQEPASFAFYSPLTRAWEFGVGGLLALSGRATGWISRRRALSPELGLLLIVASALMLDSGSPFPGMRALPVVLGTALLLVQRPGSERTVLVRTLSSGPAVRLGDLSYSVYLWHWPAFVLLRAAWGPSAAVDLAAVSLTIGAAVVSFKALEEPFRRDRSISGARAVRLFVACVAVPSVIAGAVGYLSVEESERVNLGSGSRHWSTDDCHFKHDQLGPWPRHLCTRGALDGSPASIDVLLLGDSHADSLSTGVAAATDELGLSLGVWTVSSQPPLGNSDWRARYAEVITEVQPKVVVLAARSLDYVAGGDSDKWITGRPPQDVSLTDLWLATLEESIGHYLGLGVRVIWVHNVPEFERDEDHLLGKPTLLSPTRSRVLFQNELQTQRGTVILREVELFAGMDGVRSVDPALTLCDPDCMDAGRDGFLYRDSNHLNSAGSRLLKEAIVESLQLTLSR